MDKKTILIAEDDKMIGPMYQTALENAGYSVVLARDGRQAWETIQKNAPDLMFLDIAMPNMNGLEVLKKISEDEALKDLPVIIVSNLSREKEMFKCLEMGAKDFKVKTEWKIAEMLETVKKYLSDK
jgi:DNA-binding response OmpR family regulator